MSREAMKARLRKVSTSLKVANSEADNERYRNTVEDMRDFCLGVPSIREVFKGKSTLLQLVWFGIFIFLLSYCLKEVGGLFERFIESPTATKIDYKVNNTLKFPQVTLCSYVRVNGSRIAQYNISEGLIAYMLSTFKGMYLFYNEGGNQQPMVPKLEAEYQTFLDTQSEDFSLLQFFLENGIECEQFFGGCMFQGADFNCCESVEEVLGDIGKCFILSPKLDEQIIPGPFGGMKLYINAMSDSYPHTLLNSNPDEGMQIHITKRDGSANLTSSPLITFPNTHAMIQLRTRYQKMLKTVDDKGNPTCTDEGAGSLRFFGDGYSMRSCFEECIARLTLEQCGCIQIGTVPSNVNRSLFCEPYAATTCILPLLQDNNASFLWELYSIHDECQCPQRCARWAFDTSVSYSAVPSPGFERTWIYPDAWLRSRNSTNLGARGIENVNKKEFTVVDIFFDSLIYTVIEEQRIFGYDVFLGSLGGQLSVWLGIRLVNVVQLLYYFGIFLIFIIPFWIRKVREDKGWRKAPEPGPIMEFKKPISLYATASMRLLSPSTILTYPNFKSPRSSIFSGWSGDESRSTRRVSIYSVGDEPRDNVMPGKTHVRELRVEDFTLEKAPEKDDRRLGSSSNSEEVEMAETSSSGSGSTNQRARLESTEDHVF